MNKEVKLKAKELIKGNIWNIFGLILLILIFVGVISSILEIIPGNNEENGSSFVMLICTYIESVITYMLAFVSGYYVLNLVRKKQVSYKESVEYLIDNIKKILIVSLLWALFIELGFICFIIPGIIVSLGLVFLPYIIIDNEQLSGMDAIKKTWNFMHGHKGEYFIFSLSFIGWILLCIFIIPAIYVIPYFSVANCLFYERIKNNA